jgi:hypothetical protein
MQRFEPATCQSLSKPLPLRKIALILYGLLVISSSFGQKTELGISLNSGLFSFAGNSAAGTSFINSNAMVFPAYTNNPYGSRMGWCDGVSVDLKRVNRGRFLLGISIGYEELRSRVSLTSVAVTNQTLQYSVAAHGHTDLASRFINLFPSAGYRLMQSKLTIDLTGGLDLARCLSTRENGKAYASNGETFTTSRDRKTIAMDVRPRLQLSAAIHKTAVYVGYSYGLINYMSGYVGGVNNSYSRLLRVGLQYQLY